MPTRRRNTGSGRLALFFALAGWACTAVSFVVPGFATRPTAAPRSAAGFRHALEREAQAQETQPWAPTVALVASVGLAVTMLSAPVQAEAVDDAAAQSDQSALVGKLSRKKKKREEAEQAAKQEVKKEEAKKQEAKPAAKPAAKQEVKKDEQGGGFSLPFALPSIPLPSFLGGEAPKGAQKAPPSEPAKIKPFKISASGKEYFNPSDERDEDELPLTRTNIPLLSAFLFGPSFVYLVFWVLGSLDII